MKTIIYYHHYIAFSKFQHKFGICTFFTFFVLFFCHHTSQRYICVSKLYKAKAKKGTFDQRASKAKTTNCHCCCYQLGLSSSIYYIHLDQIIYASGLRKDFDHLHLDVSRVLVPHSTLWPQKISRMSKAKTIHCYCSYILGFCTFNCSSIRFFFLIESQSCLD